MQAVTPSALNILLVEDEDTYADSVIEAFADAPEQVCVTRKERLKEALQQLATVAFDVVLLDLTLPDAFDLMGVIAIRKAAPNISLVVLTGSVEATLGSRVIAAGADDFLQKAEVDADLLRKGLILRSIRYARARRTYEEERTKLDQRLRDQHFYTRSLIEANIDALMAIDPRGIITDVNKQTEALTGCTRDELIGAPFKNYFTDPRLAEAGIYRVLTEGKVTNYELTMRARDGKQTIVSCNATTFHDRDRILQGVFVAARDVTG